jgi:hypothetical protein
VVTGNSNLVYTIIRKRAVFHTLANLPTDINAISKTLAAAGAKRVIGAIPGQKSTTSAKRSGAAAQGGQSAAAAAESPGVVGVGIVDGEQEQAESPTSPPPMEGSRPALPAEPGTLKATLAATPSMFSSLYSRNKKPVHRVLAVVVLGRGSITVN